MIKICNCKPGHYKTGQDFGKRKKTLFHQGEKGYHARDAFIDYWFKDGRFVHFLLNCTINPFYLIQQSQFAFSRSLILMI